MRIKKKNILFEQRIKSNMLVPSEVKQLHSLFVKNGFNVYIVGGAVRDTLMGKPIKDYDLATDAPPETVEKMLKTAGIRTIGTGAAFGVINAYVNGEEYEIATFREDVGKGRRPDSVIFSDIETDVKRRDLTINALFYDISTKEIVDLVGGMEDIKNGVVRTVGDAGERFDEDRLRIMRAVRFAGRTGSKLDPAIDKSLRQNNSLEGISGERIMDEFVKGITSAKSTKYFLSLLDKYNLFDWIFRGISPINKQFVDSNDELRVIAVLLKDVSYDTINKQLNALKYSSNQIKPIVFMVAYYQLFSEDTFYTLKKMHKNSGVSSNTFLAFVELMGGDIGIARKFINFQLSITGDVVKQKYGMTDGPELGVKIKELETQRFFSS
tara:strand:- start:2483 stop:3625 length:1143 start_codon:yes stop_codon:yes gene_type:complete